MSEPYQTNPRTFGFPTSQDPYHEECGCFHCHERHIQEGVFDPDCCEDEKCPDCDGWGTNGYRGEGDGRCLNCKGTGRVYGT